MFLLFRFFSLWPLRVLHALGAAMGWAVWFLSSRYRATFRANVAQAGLPFEAARPAIAEAGRFVAELPKLWMRPHDQSCLELVQVSGQAHAEAAFAAGHGVIFFAPHAGSFELAPQALAELYGPVTAMYRPARQAWLARLMQSSRLRPGLLAVPANLSGIRQMHRALKGNGAVALLTDQVPPEVLGLWISFFGKPAYTMTLPAKLALMSGATIILSYAERLSFGRGYAVHFVPFERQLIGTPEEQAEIINIAMEDLITRCPSQYFWSYNRFKGQPPVMALSSDQAS